MHELGVMHDTLTLALEHATRQHARSIHRIVLRIGPLAGVVPEAMAFAFDVVAAGTIAEGAALEVEDVPLACVCRSCGNEFEPPPFTYDCPRCQAPGARVVRGRELELASMEIS
jgi:hydrogenase nickel incorporation protein HypA/HybF